MLGFNGFASLIKVENVPPEAICAFFEWPDVQHFQ
jgi:hypothetical protein